MPKTKKNKHKSKDKQKYSGRYYYLISTIGNEIISKVKKKDIKSNDKLIFLIDKNYEPHINNNIINGNIIPINNIFEILRICVFIKENETFKPAKINNILFKIDITNDIDLNDLKWSNKKNLNEDVDVLIEGIYKNADDDNSNKNNNNEAIKFEIKHLQNYDIKEENIDESTIVDWNIEKNINKIDDKKEKNKIIKDIKKHKKDQEEEKKENDSCDEKNNPFFKLKQIENNKEQKFNLIVKNNGISKNKEKNYDNTNNDFSDDYSNSSNGDDDDENYNDSSINESSSSAYEHDHHFNNIFDSVIKNQDGSNNKSPLYYKYKGTNCKFYFELDHDKKKIYLVKFLIEF